MKGRPKKSDQEKKALGTFRKHRANTEVPESKLPDKVSPSFILDSSGRKVWNKTIKFLKENNMMGEVDLDMLTVYCNEMARYFSLNKKMKQAEKDIENERKRLEKEGSNVMEITLALQALPSPYAYLKICHEAMEKALKISDRFGFTPQSRQKLKAEKPAEQTDPILAMMNPKFRENITAKA
jgi:P27 family predicted phage terminase small subunit